MTTLTKALAKRIAKRLKGEMTWDAIRDEADQMSDGELDCWQLDTLTDWIIEARAPDA